MDFVYALLLGAVQGVTEFLPVSSSGCLMILERMIGTELPALTFHVFLHTGTTLAVMLAFRKDLARLAAEGGRAFRSLRFSLRKKRGGVLTEADSAGIRTPAGRTSYQRLFDLLMAAALPSVLLGVLLHALFTRAEASCFTAGVGFFLTGILLLVTDRVAPGDTVPRELPMRSAWLIGAVRSLAFIPGLSGTGTALSAGILTGFSRKNAIRFTFLLSVPITVTALCLELVQAFAGGGLSLRTLGVCLTGFAASAVTGSLVIGRLLRLLRDMKLANGAWVNLMLGLAAVFAAHL